MKRILVISPYQPSASGAGVQQRLANHIAALEQHAKVDLHILEPLTRGRRSGRLGVLADIASTLWRNGRFLAGNMSVEPLLETIRTGEYDILFCFRAVSAAQLIDHPNWDTSQYKQLWVDFDDIESLALERANSMQGKRNGTLVTCANTVRIRAYRALESRLMSLADRIIICSGIDRSRLAGVTTSAQISVIPNVVSTEENHEPVEIDSTTGAARLLFVGTMSYDPNIDAMHHFVDDILPIIRRSTGREVKLLIVGFDPPADIRCLGESEYIEVTGGVDNVSDYYRACDLVIVPIRFGGGTRIKILEACAHRRPVVSTTLGSEGLELQPGSEILIADQSADFAASCIELIDYPERAARMAAKAADTVASKYSINAISQNYARMIAG